MLQRTLRLEVTIKVPLQACAGRKPSHVRYQLRRRGKIARLLKPKRKTTV